MNTHTLPPELQALVNEPFSEPPSRACEHWKALAKAMEKLDHVRTEQARYDTAVSRLREELALARARDQQALGVLWQRVSPSLSRKRRRSRQRSSAICNAPPP